MSLLAGIAEYIVSVESDFSLIPIERKQKLEELATYIRDRSSKKNVSYLIFICTHNSRRSHISQLWAQAAAYYYRVPEVYCYSGGTEATAFNPRAVKTMRKAGFVIDQKDISKNPVYLVKYAEPAEPVKVFSKRFDDPFNPGENFAAIMTCSDADEACPFVPGTLARIAITYKDPKEADDTLEEEDIYDERCRQIAVEMFYVFSIV